MRYLKKFNENISNSVIFDIKDIFVDKIDGGFSLYHESFSEDSDYPFFEEFMIYKKGNSGYYLGGHKIELFDINEILDEVLRFSKICLQDELKYRIITSDGEFILDITNKINCLSTVNKSDVLESTHLNFKKNKGVIDLKNVKFLSCQILK